jgi:hypothetical protein
MRRMARYGMVCCAALLAAMFASACPAREEGRPVATTVTDAIESCVDEASIRFGPADRRAFLEAADTTAVSAAITRRYPMIEQDGLTPQSLVLWRQPEFGWVYVALLVNPAKPGEVCFTATFGADKFDLSGPLIEKYFGAGAANI